MPLGPARTYVILWRLAAVREDVLFGLGAADQMKLLVTHTVVWILAHAASARRRVHSSQPLQSPSACCASHPLSALRTPTGACRLRQATSHSP